jgi:hypothetical protein
VSADVPQRAPNDAHDATAAADPGAEVGVAPSGSGFRAIARRGGTVIWSCPHVHFTEHSAKNCPALRGARFG